MNNPVKGSFVLVIIIFAIVGIAACTSQPTATSRPPSPIATAVSPITATETATAAATTSETATATETAADTVTESASAVPTDTVTPEATDATTMTAGTETGSPTLSATELAAQIGANMAATASGTAFAIGDAAINFGTRMNVPAVGAVPPQYAEGWTRATGSILFGSGGENNVTVQVNGLVPNGTYSIWWYHPGGANKYIAASNNYVFHPDSSGNATLTFTAAPEDATRTLFILFHADGKVPVQITERSTTDYIQLFGSAEGTPVLPEDFGTSTGLATPAATP